MYQYRIFRRIGRAAWRTAVVIAVLVSVLLAASLARVAILLHRVHPVLNYTFLGVIALVVLTVLIQLHLRRKDHRVLKARGFTLSSRASHSQMKEYLRYLISCAKRLATHRLLTDDQAMVLRQRASELDDTLNHHPLNDDLVRAIVKARDQVISPAFGTLGAIGERITASKARAVIQDLYQPPFPVIPPVVVFYHQFTLVSEIVDLYLPQPTLGEYYRVHRDVLSLMTKGDFLRFGQRLFSGITHKSYRLGRAAEDLGQMFSVAWLTHAFSAAATMRCCTLHDWSTHAAIRDMQLRVIPILEQTRDVLLQEAMPIIKKRIRTFCPLERDPEQFADEIAATFTRAVESVVVTQRNAMTASSTAAETSPGLINSHHGLIQTVAADGAPAAPGSPLQPIKVRKRRRHRRRSNRPKMSFLKQIMYIIRGPK